MGYGKAEIGGNEEKGVNQAMEAVLSIVST